MTLSMKLGGAWKEAQSLHVKINGEWKDIATLYSKKDGVWVTVYSSGALIEFADYPYPIPVAQGWKYSTDGKVWTTVEADGEINTDGGMFTGFIKANSITLSDYCTEYTPGEYGLRVDGTSLSSPISEKEGSFVLGSKGYVMYARDVYDAVGNKTRCASLSVSRSYTSAFVNNSKAYVCGGNSSSAGYRAEVDIFDESGNVTSGNPLSVARAFCMSFTVGSLSFVCGGSNDSYSDVVDKYDSSGNRSKASSLSSSRAHSGVCVNGNWGYICGGVRGYNSYTFWGDRYDSSGNRRSADLSGARGYLSGFTINNLAYMCGGQSYSNSDDVYWTEVDVFDSIGNRTTGNPLSVGQSETVAFVNNSRGYLCGGTSRLYTNGVQVCDSNGNWTRGNALSSARSPATSFVNASRGYVCGGESSSSSSAGTAVDIYYDTPEIISTKIPITEGSTYTLNGESGTADVSKVMEFDSKVSGTIKYKKGDLLPGVKVTVVDENGDVVEDAIISINDKPYDLSGAYYIDTSIDTAIYYVQFTLAGVSINDISKVDKVVLSGSYIFGSERTYSKDVSPSYPNGDYIVATAPVGGDGASVQSMTFTAYDVDGNVLQTAEISKRT